jgi:hypothetical protein
MSLVGFGSASSRRTIVILGLAAFVSAASVAGAQDPPTDGQAPSAPAPAAGAGAQQAPAPATEDAFKFTTDAAVVIWQIKPEATADFESVWNVIRSRAASATDSPEAKAIVDSMTLYRHVAPASATGPVAYFFQIDPVVKTATYDPTFLLFNSGLFERPEADELFNKLSASINPPGINPVPLQKMEVTPVAAPMPPMPSPSAPSPDPSAPGQPPPPPGAPGQPPSGSEPPAGGASPE